MNILDEYSNNFPLPSSALSIFDGEWISRIPTVGGGNVPLFEDGRISWWEGQAGGFFGKTILELGPLEGGHTYQLYVKGANRIISVEANQRNFVKCLIIKNILRFEADFMLGDFRPYIQKCKARFDFILMSGVLYHMTSPHLLILDAARIANEIGIWTHYYDKEIIFKNDLLRSKFEQEPDMVSVTIENKEICLPILNKDMLKRWSLRDSAEVLKNAVIGWKKEIL